MTPLISGASARYNSSGVPAAPPRRAARVSYRAAISCPVARASSQGRPAATSFCVTSFEIKARWSSIGRVSPGGSGKAAGTSRGIGAAGISPGSTVGAPIASAARRYDAAISGASALISAFVAARCCWAATIAAPRSNRAGSAPSRGA